MNRTGARSSAVLAGVLAAVLVVGGCADGPFSSDADLPGTDTLPDCSADECAEEVAALGEALRTLDGVERVEDLRYRGGQITAGASVDGVVRVAAGTDCAALEDGLGRLLWESQVSPVGSAQLRCFLPGAAGSDYDYVTATFLATDDVARAEQQWGPRGG